jgi:nucleotide-binding universal stress UspA family protein
MSRKIKTVLIGTSLTAASDAVVRTGLKVARATKARVVLAHAYSPDLAYSGAPFVPERAMDEVLENKRESLRRQMETQAIKLGIYPEELAGMTLAPTPAHQMLMETAQKTGAGLIVVGNTEAPLLSTLLGSTTDRVVRKATCPVLVVRREMPMPPARVLLPVDLSFLSAEGFREGLEVLALLAGERMDTLSPGTGERGNGINLEALHVVTDRDPYLFAPKEPAERTEIHCQEELGRFVFRHAAGSPFAVVPRTVSGYVEDEILLRIGEWKPDLVVLGTHGRSGFELFLLGSVAARVIRDGGANVLAVPLAAAREQAWAVRAAIQQEVMVA